MSDHTRSRADTKIKVQENRIRRSLSRNDYQLRKSRQGFSKGNLGQYQVRQGDKIVAGQNYELSLDDIENMLWRGDLFLYGEILTYLTRLTRKNPWFHRRGGGYQYLILFYKNHFLRQDINEKAICKRCKSPEQVIKSGKTNEKQRYHCKSCGYHFTIGDFRRRIKNIMNFV